MNAKLNIVLRILLCLALCALVAVNCSCSQESADAASSTVTLTFARIIIVLYHYAMLLFPYIAALAVLGAGCLVVLSGFDPKYKERAKQLLGGVFGGYLLILLSYMILSMISHDLVKLKDVRVQPPPPAVEPSDSPPGQ